MITDPLTYDSVKDEIKTLYVELLNVAKDNEFLKKMNEQTIQALNDLSISDDEKSKALIAIHTATTEQTLSKTFDQALQIISTGHKLPKELEEMDARIDLLEQQKNEVIESAEDRKAKRGAEVAILTQQELLIKQQILKLIKDSDYVDAQKNAMLEQVEDNRFIKAMDSLGEVIGTLGNGGMQVPKKLFEVYFLLNNLLTEVETTGTDNIQLTKVS